MSSQSPIDPKPLPHAGRPRGDAWRALVAEGIEWEGQVLLGSEDHPLSARLIITSQRLAFAKGGEVVLDIARWWLKRPPFLSGNGAVNLRIETGSGHRDRLSFMARDGRPASSDIVTLLTHGKQALPSAPLEPVYTEVPRRSSPARSEPEPVEPEPRTKPLVDDGHIYAESVIDATTLQVLDTTDFPPVTETQTPSTHRGSTAGAGAMAGEPITISTLGNQTHRSGDWALNPIPSLDMRSSRPSRTGWAFRLSGLVVLIALAAALGTSNMPDTNLRDHGNSIIAPLTGGDTATAENLAQVVSTATTESSGGETQATIDAQATSIALGIGGDDITETQTVTSTSTVTPSATMTASTEPTTPAPTEPVIIPADDETATSTPPVETATETPTETVTAQPTDTPFPTDTTAPTETATTEPTVEPTETATLAATEIVSPTVGVTDTATTVPADTETSEPTETMTAEPTPTEGFPFQNRTVGDDELPDQVFATGQFRYTVEYAERGAEIPTLELPPVDAGEWVVIVLHAMNWSSEPATLNMADFQLLVSGDFGYQFVGMDASSPDIGRFLGFDPVLEIAELRSIPSGEGLRIALVYLVPPATTAIELIDDTSGLNLARSLDAGGDVTNLGGTPVPPDLLEAVVTEVIDGRTIVVEAEGFSATIQYLGVAVPTGDQCFSGDSTLTNSNIVLGKTIYLEREHRNRVDANGEVLARDVWIDNASGGLVLVSAWMASEGAAIPDPEGQDTRFAGWIQAAADAGAANTLGFWAVCGTPPVDPASAESEPGIQAIVPIEPFLTFDQ